MNIKEIINFFLEEGEQKFRIEQVKKAVFQDGVSSFSEMSTLSKALREKLGKNFKLLSLETVQILKSKDGQSIKALMKLEDGNLLETVLISPKPDVWSACVSTQVGCPMGCRFCATGAMGFRRNLTAEEITDQVLFWMQYLKKESQKLSTIVYMGMGEPFMNWIEVKESLKILTTEDLFGFGSRSISVSTSGIVDGIIKLANEFPQVNLAISLHFADDEKRSQYMPVNKKDNMENLKSALLKYLEKTKRKVFIEYILLDKINDSKKDADALADFLLSTDKIHLFHVNLIRYNTTSAGFFPSSKEKARQFKDHLMHKRVDTTIRKSLGDEIQGACGQLAGK